MPARNRPPGPLLQEEEEEEEEDEEEEEGDEEEEEEEEKEEELFTRPHALPHLHTSKGTHSAVRVQQPLIILTNPGTSEQHSGRMLDVESRWRVGSSCGIQNTRLLRCTELFHALSRNKIEKDTDLVVF